MRENDGLRRSILAELRRGGPLPSRALAVGRADVGWRSAGWTNERNVSRMLDFLWAQGKVMVAGRQGGQRLWDLAERCLPAHFIGDRLSDHQVTRIVAQRSLRFLGVATLAHIRGNFLPGRYVRLPAVLEELEREGRIEQVSVTQGRSPLAGTWYVHADDVALLDEIEQGRWEPRGTLLAPFDNLIRDRSRVQELFGFDCKLEIYVPRAKRLYGYYVMPILHGDRLAGRLDPATARQRGVLQVNAVGAEPGAPRGVAGAIGRALRELAAFVGARSVLVSGPVSDVCSGLNGRRS